MPINTMFLGVFTPSKLAYFQPLDRSMAKWGKMRKLACFCKSRFGVKEF